MSIPFPPDFEKVVTTFPFAGQRQPLKVVLPPFAAALLLFFRLPVEAVFLPPDVCEADFFEVVGAFLVFVELPEAFLALLVDLPDERLAVFVEELPGGRVSRSFCPG